MVYIIDWPVIGINYQKPQLDTNINENINVLDVYSDIMLIY